MDARWSAQGDAPALNATNEASCGGGFRLLDLPPEIVIEVAVQLLGDFSIWPWGQRDVSRLCRTSHAVYKLAKPVLYSRTHTSNPADILMERFTEQPDLCSSLHSLSLAINIPDPRRDLAGHPVPDCTPLHRTWFGAFARLAKSFTALESFHVMGSAIPIPLLEMASTLKILPALRSIRLYTVTVGARPDHIRTLPRVRTVALQALKQPGSERTVSPDYGVDDIRQVFCGAADVTLDLGTTFNGREDAQALRYWSSVRQLHLSVGYTDGTAITALAAMPALESLHLSLSMPAGPGLFDARLLALVELNMWCMDCDGARAFGRALEANHYPRLSLIRVVIISFPPSAERIAETKAAIEASAANTGFMREPDQGLGQLDENTEKQTWVRQMDRGKS